jgi:small conductance mechanosensitive channel
MESLKPLYEALPNFIPVLAVIAISLPAIWLVNQLMARRSRKRLKDGRFSRQLTLLVLGGTCVVLAVMALPLEDKTQQNMLAILGLVLSVAVALSSTTFVGNMMAGLMLRSIGSFAPGDFVRIEDQFGRVTVRGLFHTEIQTEDRDLATIPNLYLVSKPIKVVRSSGTFLSATLSLGYEYSHTQIIPLLKQAAVNTGLEDPFVRLMELGDDSVQYQIAGFLSEVKQLLSMRSSLRRHVLDTLHGAGVEIVSPNFMNQRRLDPSKPVMPTAAVHGSPTATHTEDEVPEELIFDKADRAEKQEQLRTEQRTLAARIAELEKELDQAEKAAHPAIERQIEQCRAKSQELDDLIDQASKLGDD